MARQPNFSSGNSSSSGSNNSGDGQGSSSSQGSLGPGSYTGDSVPDLELPESELQYTDPNEERSLRG
ncbi:hypothetical protein H4219_003544 [Mycoemilia scoparia]|uniref:Uncharacterized protein n=1 Tax=Mycoemilia scoparia TaxID=417184 RepID=A0A9W8DT73_9FUNG|nr:hypothetical protein H4219_003544 [Mycoemilia scoparia]